ncbi:MAG: hypothetical protein ABIY55_35175 [Kofleriaceae bacterium]
MRPGGQREKGKTFERKVARILRARWRHALVRRASQAERAHNPDVFIEEGPRVLKRLWLELQDSAHPTPSAKLAQARRDIAADPRRYESGDRRLPVAVTHELGSSKILATMDIVDVLDLLGVPFSGPKTEAGEVTMPLDTLLSFVERGVTADVLRQLADTVPPGERHESEAA